MRPAGHIILGDLTARTRERMRAVPVPARLIHLLIQLHGLRAAWTDEEEARRRAAPIYGYGRSAMSYRVARVIAAAGNQGGPHAVLKGIRHGFGVHAIRCRILLTTVQEWMGHSCVATTADYVRELEAHVPELLWDERTEAERMW